MNLATLIAISLCIQQCNFVYSQKPRTLRSTSTQAEIIAKQLLPELNQKLAHRMYRAKLATWNYDSNITDFNLKNKLEILEQVAQEDKADWMLVKRFKWQEFQDYDLKRQFMKKSNLGTNALPDKKLLQLETAINMMKGIYSTTNICIKENGLERCNLSLEPDMVDIIGNSQDPAVLQQVWVNWHDSVGPPCKKYFTEYIKLFSESCRLNNFTNCAEQWLASYEDPNFIKVIEDLWNQLEPLYLQLHAYVRTQLRRIYGNIVSNTRPIPIHLLGNMWGQKWGMIAKRILPFPSKQMEDLTKELQEQNYTPKKIFKTAEEFFVSIGLDPMPQSFWKNSILTKPKDRQMVCHASAWDFANGKDFRIKQCTKVIFPNFLTAHHEMGHVQYYLQYKDQPPNYQRGANDGFHEAIGDVIALSVQSRKHLRKIGLLKNPQDDPESVLNSLFKMGLNKIAFLPFALSIDFWRWGVFRGEITPENYNCKWWELKEKYQGVEPPVERSNQYFDPAAKYHVVANVPYLRYFISYVIQFQFYRSLCQYAGEYEPNNPDKPLYNCDIYNSVAAGQALKRMLKLGSSRPWPDALEVLTGQRTIDGSAMAEYFKPLKLWLENENKKSGAFIGWKPSKKRCI